MALEAAPVVVVAAAMDGIDVDGIGTEVGGGILLLVVVVVFVMG